MASTPTPPRANPTPTTSTKTVPHYHTRSQTTKARENARKKAEKKNQNQRIKQKRENVCIKKSQIPNAGLGLYILEDAEAGVYITRYSGTPRGAEENKKSCGDYRVQVHKNLFLDAKDPNHFESRYINDSRGSKFEPNARFTADYKTNTCSKTSYTWIKIFALRPLTANEEIFLDYGEDYPTN